MAKLKNEYLYAKNNVTTQNNKPKSETAKNTNVSEKKFNEISWGEDNNIDNTSLYLESLQEYVKKELPQKYKILTKQDEGEKVCTTHYSSYQMPYSKVYEYCKSLDGSWQADNSHNSNNRGLAKKTWHSRKQC